MKALLAAAALLSVLTTTGIVVTLVTKSARFFGEVPFRDFFLGKDWAPLAGGASQSFGVAPLIWSTLYLTLIALAVAVPLDLGGRDHPRGPGPADDRLRQRDAMSAVPQSLREGAFGLGAAKWQVVLRVVFPAALSGVLAGLVLGASRAIGETVVILVASGNNPNLTFDLTVAHQNRRRSSRTSRAPTSPRAASPARRSSPSARRSSR